MDLSTAQVPDSDLLYVKRNDTTVAAPLDYFSLDLEPFKFRRKLWLSVGVVNTPGTLVIDGFLEFLFNGESMLVLPYRYQAFASSSGKNIFFGSTSTFGTAAAFSLFDEAFFADFGGKFIGTTPFRCVLAADKVRFRIDRHVMAGGDTFFGFMACQQEFPY